VLREYRNVLVRDMTSKFIYRYVNLLYHKQCSVLHVSATYCDHLKGEVLCKIYYVHRT